MCILEGGPRSSIVVIKPYTEEIRNILFGQAERPGRKITIVAQTPTGGSLFTQPNIEGAISLLEKLRKLEPFTRLQGEIIIDT